MGLTPSEKKRYNESKKRRRQALESYETGRIKPIRSKSRIFAVIAAVLAVAVIVSIVVLVKSMGSGSQSAVPAVSQSYNSADLLKIVSARYPLEKTEVPELSDFQGYKVNSIMLSDIKKMFDAAKDKGISLKIKSAYISYDEQEKLFEKKLKEVNRDGKFSQVRRSSPRSTKSLRVTVLSSVSPIRKRI